MITLRTRLRRPSGDRGLTLVEVSVALVLVSIVFAAVMPFLITTVRQTATNEKRVKATQLGSQVVEDLKTVKWQAVGFLPADFAGGVVPAGNVEITAADAANRPAWLRPTRVESLDGEDYTITTSVLWSAGSDDTTQRSKTFDVVVNWQEAGGAKSVPISGERASTTLEVPVETGSAVAVVATPSTLAIDSAGLTTQSALITATTGSASAQVRLNYVLRNGVTAAADMSPTGATSYAYTLPVGSGPFDPGSTDFIVQASSLSNVQTTGSTAVTFTSGTVGFGITNINVNPSAVNLTAGDRNVQSISIIASFSSPATSSTAFLPTASGEVPLAMTMADDGLSASVEIAESGYEFVAGDRQVRVRAAAAAIVETSTALSLIAASVPIVAILDVTASPGFCFQSSNGNNFRSLLKAVRLSVTVEGLRSTDQVQVQLDTRNSPQSLAAYQSGTDPSLWFVDLPAGSTIEARGNSLAVNVQVSGTRLPDGTPTTASFPLSIASASSVDGCPA